MSVRAEAGLRLSVIDMILVPMGWAVLTGANAQQSPPAGAAPAYKPLRFDEDYSYLQDLMKRTEVWDPIKYIPLSFDPSWALSLGGELRERFEYYSNPDFGLRGPEADGYLLHHRILLHADLHLPIAANADLDPILRISR